MNYECCDDLLPASYNGIPFWVNNDAGTYGRRIETHEYPMRDTAFQEDLGKKNSSWKVKGYVFGAGATAIKSALVAAVNAGGSAVVVLPGDGPINVRCKLLNVQRSRDEQCWFTLDFDFVLDDGAAGVPVGIPIFDGLLSSALTASATPLATFFDATAQVTDVLPFVVSNQVGRVQTFAANINAATASTAMPATIAGNLANTTAQLSTNANALLSAGGAAIVPLVQSCVSAIVNNMSPDDAMAALQPFTTFAVAEAPAQSASTSDTADANNALAFDTAVRVTALIGYSQAVAAYVYPTRPLAIQARADLAEMFNNEIINLAPSDSATNVAETARNLIVKSLSQQITNLKPIVFVEAGINLPALYWAHRLYGAPNGSDAIETNAISLVDLNAIPDPDFMPVEFEALAS